jgi:hypothetical protein
MPVHAGKVVDDASACVTWKMFVDCQITFNLAGRVSVVALATFPLPTSEAKAKLSIINKDRTCSGEPMDVRGESHRKGSGCACAGHRGKSKCHGVSDMATSCSGLSIYFNFAQGLPGAAMSTRRRASSNL